MSNMEYLSVPFFILLNTQREFILPILSLVRLTLSQ